MLARQTVLVGELRQGRNLRKYQRGIVRYGRHMPVRRVRPEGRRVWIGERGRPVYGGERRDHLSQRGVRSQWDVWSDERPGPVLERERLPERQVQCSRSNGASSAPRRRTARAATATPLRGHAWCSATVEGCRRRALWTFPRWRRRDGFDRARPVDAGAGDDAGTTLGSVASSKSGRGRKAAGGITVTASIACAGTGRWIGLAGTGVRPPKARGDADRPAVGVTSPLREERLHLGRVPPGAPLSTSGGATTWRPPGLPVLISAFHEGDARGGLRARVHEPKALRMKPFGPECQAAVAAPASRGPGTRSTRERGARRAAARPRRNGPACGSLRLNLRWRQRAASDRAQHRTGDCTRRATLPPGVDERCRGRLPERLRRPRSSHWRRDCGAPSPPAARRSRRERRAGGGAVSRMDSERPTGTHALPSGSKASEALPPRTTTPNRAPTSRRAKVVFLALVAGRCWRLPDRRVRHRSAAANPCEQRVDVGPIASAARGLKKDYAAAKKRVLRRFDDGPVTERAATHQGCHELPCLSSATTILERS